METNSSVYERRRALVHDQVQKIGIKAIKGEVCLPLDEEAVLRHVDSNFSFYFGTMTRRGHYESHGLSQPLSYEEVNQQYSSAIRHIGFMVNRANDSNIESGVVLQLLSSEADLEDQQIAA